MKKPAVIIVTGASRGLGAGIARWLSQAGAHLVLAARSPISLDALNGPGTATAVATDVSDPAACRRLVDTALERYGRLDGLVNNAAVVTPLAPLASADPAEWLRSHQINLLGPVCLTRGALPALRRSRGRIVNISSGAAVHAIEGAGAYCVSKAALNHFTAMIAAEEPEVTAVALRPGVVDTPMQTVLRRQPMASQAAFYRRLKQENQLEPPMVPARVAAWLALAAPPELTGRFVSYDDSVVADAAAAALGPVPAAEDVPGPDR
jgi:NAD(P)-dependent dehydrogenase (short-subunit alcohol dehydrogenase family)